MRLRTTLLVMLACAALCRGQEVRPRNAGPEVLTMGVRESIHVDIHVNTSDEQLVVPPIVRSEKKTTRPSATVAPILRSQARTVGVQ